MTDGGRVRTGVREGEGKREWSEDAARGGSPGGGLGRERVTDVEGNRGRDGDRGREGNRRRVTEGVTRESMKRVR